MSLYCIMEAVHLDGVCTDFAPDVWSLEETCSKSKKEKRGLDKHSVFHLVYLYGLFLFFFLWVVVEKRDVILFCLECWLLSSSISIHMHLRYFNWCILNKLLQAKAYKIIFGTQFVSNYLQWISSSTSLDTNFDAEYDVELW
jgi:hypothetical protein